MFPYGTNLFSYKRLRENQRCQHCRTGMEDC